MDDLRFGPCFGKEHYANKGEALLRIKRFSRRDSRRDASRMGNLAPYYCARCDCWHVGARITLNRK